MAYEVPDLTYGFDALEPHIDAKTMEIHHDKHHQAYVDKANAALEGTEWADKPVEEVLKNLSSLPQDKQGPVRNNAGGHANHSLFWTVIGPNGGGTPSGELGSAIDSTFGGFDALKKQLIDAGVNRFGSGWSWLVVSNGDPRHRRLGARVLPELPEPPARLPRGDLQRHRLVGRLRALHRRPLRRRDRVTLVILSRNVGV
jgi:superoxide dismutase